MNFENYFPFATFDILTEGIKQDYRISEDKLMVDVPGFSKEDLEIELDGGILYISGKKEIEGKIYETKKRFKVPQKYSSNLENIKAKVSDGLLIIEFSSNNTKRSIEIS